MEFKKIILLVFSLLSIYLIYKIRHLEKLSKKYIFDKFESTDTSDISMESLISNVINDKYKTDMSSIERLNTFVNSLLSETNTLDMPSNIYTKDVIIDGPTTINGSMLLEDSINISNINNILINLIPQYMIIAYANKKIPNGWAICNGSRYKMNQLGFAYSVDINDTSGILTPNLQSRFILGSGLGKINDKPLKRRILNDKEGEEEHLLTVAELPSHSHKITAYHDNYRASSAGEDNFKYNGWSKDTTYTGGRYNPIDKSHKTIPHNNMPPYYVLTYIMKL